MAISKKLLSEEECLKLSNQEVKNNWKDYSQAKPEYSIYTSEGRPVFIAKYNRSNIRNIEDSVQVTIFRDTSEINSCIIGCVSG